MHAEEGRVFIGRVFL